MGFFSEIELPGEAFQEPEPRRVRWRGDTEDTVGVLAPLGPFHVHNDQVAIVVTGFYAYPAGFTFSLVMISRLDPSPTPLGFHHPGRPGPRSAPGGEFRFGIRFADGSKVFLQYHPLAGTESSARLLRTRGGGGGGRKWSQEFWCEPLPPTGPMAFIFEWGDFAVLETSIDIDADLVIDAATHAQSLWPEDADLPEDREHSPRPWATRSSAAMFRKTQT